MTRLRLRLEQENEWPLAIHASGPSVIIEGDFRLPTLSLLAFSAGGDGGRRSPELPLACCSFHASGSRAGTVMPDGSLPATLHSLYENRVGRIAVNAMSAKRTHRIRGSASILRSNSIAIIGTAMIA